MNEEKREDIIRIAFVLPRLEIGGVGRSLLTLLDALNQKHNVEIHILLFHKSGELLSHVPAWVHVEQIEGMDHQENLRSFVARILRQKGLRIFFNFAKKLYHWFGYQGKTKKKREFDIAVGYQDGAATWYVAKNIDAGKKVAFIHTDFKKAQYNCNQERKAYLQFNQIYCVSSGARESFLQVLPEFKDKTQVFPNIINPDGVRELSNQAKNFQDDFVGIRLLSVGRLSHEKGLDKAVRVLKRLLDEGHHVRWYVIGQGPEKNSLETLVKEMKVEKDFYFMGIMENPYGFMSKCDVYVQPSSYEGYSIAVAEARALCRPIVACDFAGAKDQLDSGVNGLICGLKEEDLYHELKKIISNEEMRACFTSTLEKQLETNFYLNQATLEEFVSL